MNNAIQSRNELPIDGFLRLIQIVGRKADPKKNLPAIPPIIPISKSSWLSGVKAGKFPPPVRLGERTVAWKVADIRKLVDQS